MQSETKVRRTKCEIDKAYYEKNREKILSRVKARYENKKEELRQYQRDYRQRKREAAKIDA